jgi:uncharacterized protein YjbI with pentapeptide repeats
LSLDINDIKRSLDSSSGLNRSLLIGFYGLMVYLAITIASVAPSDLFFPNHTLSLPILKIDLNITYFFTFTPLVVLVIHVNLLVNLIHHRNKLEAYIQEDPNASPLYYHPFLYNFIRKSYAESEHSRKYNFATTNFLRIFIWTSLVILPLVVLVFMQVKFLPVQNQWVNIGLVGIVFLDAFFLWRFRKAISTQPYEMPAQAADAEALSEPGDRPATEGTPESTGEPTIGPPADSLPKRVLSGGLVYLKLLMVVATPLLSLSLYLSAGSTPKKSDRFHFNLQDMVLAESKSDVKGILGSAPKLETAWAELAMADKVEGRNIRFGQFDRSIFTRISFRASDLRETSFRYTRFEYVNFQDAHASKTDFSGATIRVGLFYRAHMPEANFENASLGTVDFDSSDLRRANFKEATMYGASFKDANLSGAKFSNTKLAGANFENADLTGAEFIQCDLRGTNFSNATLVGANFTLDTLIGADFSRANMQGAYIGNGRTEGAIFFNTKLEGAILVNLIPTCTKWKVNNPEKVFLRFRRDSTYLPIDSAFYASVLPLRVQVSPQTEVLTPRRSFFERVNRVKGGCQESSLADAENRFNLPAFSKAIQEALCNSEFTSCEKLIQSLPPDVRQMVGKNFCVCQDGGQ